MKKYITIIFLLSLSFVESQNNQEGFLSVGKPTFNDKEKNNYNGIRKYL